MLETSPTSSATDEPAPRPLVEVASRPIPVHLAGLVLLGTVIFFIAGLLVPFNGQAPMAVAVQTILCALTLGFATMSTNGDRMSAFRLASVFFLLSFCVGDLFNDRRLVWYFIDSYPDLMLRSAMLALLCFLMMILGYYLPFWGRIPASIPARHERVDPTRASILGLVFFGIGVFFFLTFFGAAGGAAVILQGQGDVSRAHFGRGIGIFFWPMMWMTSGGVMYFAARVSVNPSRWLFYFWPLVVEFLLLSLLQGRHRALGPLLMGLIVLNYMRRPIRLPRLVLLGAVGAVFAITMSVARGPSLRADFYADPAALVRTLTTDFWHHTRGLMTQDLGRISKVMIIVDKVPRVRPYDMGETLKIPFNPIFRIIGMPHLQAQAVGATGYMLARPDIVIDPTTTPGFLPSVVGEFRWNFPWPVCLLFWAGYGALLRWLYQRLIVDRSDFASVAIYAAFGLYLVEIIFQSVTQNIFEMVDVVLPMYLMRALSRRFAPSGHGAQLLPGEPPAGGPPLPGEASSLPADSG